MNAKVFPLGGKRTPSAPLGGLETRVGLSTKACSSAHERDYQLHAAVAPQSGASGHEYSISVHRHCSLTATPLPVRTTAAITTHSTRTHGHTRKGMRGGRYL